MASTITAGNATNGLALSCDNTGILELKTGTGSGTTAMTIGTGQQVAVTLGSAAAPSITFSGDTNTGIFSPAADVIAFSEGGVESARIDSSGNLLVGTTTSAVGGAIVSRVAVVGVTSGFGISTAMPAVGGAYYYHNFGTSGGVQTGYILSNDGTTTTYATSSDYRLKKNVQPMQNALAKVAALKPCTYTWKSTGKIDEGFIAHELQEVCPSAVTGEKDAVNEDGSIKPQGIDTSFLVATLTAAIQEQQQMIETLQAKVAALEAK